MDALDADTKSEILDIPKQIKANGSFDKFRRDCFNEITAQAGFLSLQKQVEDFVLNFLSEQKPNSKKSLVREKLRRTLNEKLFLSHGIDKLIESILEPKLDSTFKPLINEMVSSTKSPVKTVLSSTAPLAATVSTHPENNPMDTAESSTSLQVTKTPLPRKVSVEDFIPKATTTPKLVNVTTPANAPKLKPMKQTEKVTPVHIEKTQVKKRPLNTSEASEKKQQQNTPQAVVKLKTPSNSETKIETVHSALEPDPTNEYKFNWFIYNYIDHIDYDAFCINPIDPSELSELKELNQI